MTEHDVFILRALLACCVAWLLFPLVFHPLLMFGFNVWIDIRMNRRYPDLPPKINWRKNLVASLRYPMGFREFCSFLPHGPLMARFSIDTVRLRVEKFFDDEAFWCAKQEILNKYERDPEYLHRRPEYEADRRALVREYQLLKAEGNPATLVKRATIYDLVYNLDHLFGVASNPFVPFKEEFELTSNES